MRTVIRLTQRWIKSLLFVQASVKADRDNTVPRNCGFANKTHVCISSCQLLFSFLRTQPVFLFFQK